MPSEETYFKPGQSGNPGGRPRKYISQLKEQGYKLSEVNDAIQALMSMDEKELREVLENEKATVLEKTVAKAMLKSLEKGTLYSMETLLSRVYGKPVEKKKEKVTGEINLNVSFNDDTTEK